MLEIKYGLKPADKRRKTRFVVTPELVFGTEKTDHLFFMDYHDNEWHNPRIVPWQNISLDPRSLVLHYAQEIFEGGKAYRHQNDEIFTFRYSQNATRFNNSAEIMCMPPVPKEDHINGVNSLIDVDRLWCPGQEGTSLYIRAFMIATENALGVKESDQYKFCIELLPCGPYFKHGFSAGKMLLTDRFKRVAEKGTGKAKCGPNYGTSLRAKRFAAQQGASQVLFLNGDNTELEEYGAMNHVQVETSGLISIPEFTGNILESITARSFLELATERIGFPIRQRKIGVEEFIESICSGKITETGGLGTAAVVSPVGSYVVDLKGEQTRELLVGDGKAGPAMKRMYDLLTGIQYGREEAPEGWMKMVQRRE